MNFQQETLLKHGKMETTAQADLTIAQAPRAFKRLFKHLSGGYNTRALWLVLERSCFIKSKK